MAVTVLWFKRDLRLADHPALARAAAAGFPVVPLYVAEPALWREADRSGRQWAFTAECLAALADGLAALGAPLVVRAGDAVEALGALHAAHGIARLVSHEETGTLWTYARDRRLAAWARGAGVPWEEVPQSGVVRRLSSRDGWAARREAFVTAAPVPVPSALPPHPVADTGRVPRAGELGLAADPCPGRQRGGRAEGEALLSSFLTVRGAGYRRAMSSPLTAAETCSRLSPHLALGTVSVREAARAAAARAAEIAAAGPPGLRRDMESFAARLAWRDHFIQKMEDAPDIEARCLHPAFEGLRPREPDAARLAAWARGETGFPFVDACMRSLAATGWLNFRMRAMLMAVAGYQLWLDWRGAGMHLARLFTDYEPGIHWSQCQMQTGVTGINALRIYNPVKQGLDQDPAGRFTRAWVPELAAVPDAFLQAPWAWEGAGRILGARYPEPVVDPVAAVRAAKAAIADVRAGAAFAAEAARVARRHGSRKDRGPGRHFVNDRQKAPRRRAPGQMEFDF